ncbi:probable serine/threonine-protein kinase pdkA [Tetranychus urticae]|nr:probable serine/threonine-protein kinase pdkA [Tetranychus urticae]
MITCARCFTSSDLWAYGCIIYQMLVGSPPFNDATDYLIFHKILALNLTFPDDKIYPEAEDLIKSLLTLDPCSRLGASDDFTLGSYPSIRSHPFFTEISQPAKITVSTSPLSSSSSSSKSPSSNLPGPSFFNPANQYPQTRWSTLHLERPPLLDFLNKEDYDLESRISCLNYDDIEPGLDEGLLLGLGLSDYPKKSESPFEKVDSTTSSSTSPPPTQRTGYNNISSNSRGGINFNSRFCKNSSSHKENSRSNNNPERSKKKGLFSKLFKH